MSFRARLGDALAELSLSPRFTHPDDLPDTIARCAALLGAEDTEVYVADLGQRELVSLYGRNRPPRPNLSLHGTVAGRAYRTEQTVVGPATEGAEPRTQLWVPIHDSAERLGVLTMAFEHVDAEVEHGARAFASLVGEYIVTKSAYGDALERTRRLEPLSLAAEMRWALLPPLTYHSPSLTISGLLEPAYDIAGDTFDYAIVGDEAHLTIFDAVGHGLTAARIASLAVSSVRNTRRSGGDLEACYREADRVVEDAFGDSLFLTAILLTLDLAAGRIRWISAGHPPPLLVRDAHVVQELPCRPSLPVGLGAQAATVAEHQLQPGDAVVLYTDGVIEARSPEGAEFGLARLGEHIGRAAAAEEPPAETLRRLISSILEHQADHLQDDATVLTATWHGR